jgi:hypothetical protein
MRLVKVRLIDCDYEILINIYLGADDEIEGNDDEFHTPPIPDDGIVTRSGKTLFHDMH